MAAIARLLLVAKAGPLADGLRGLLMTIPGVEIVGPEEELSSALAAILKHRPAVVLLEADLAERKPAAVVRQLKAMSPNSSCVVLADDVTQRRVAEEEGADAVLLKGCRPAELVDAVRRLLFDIQLRNQGPAA